MYGIQYPIFNNTYQVLLFTLCKKEETLVEKMGAFVIGFGNLCADIKRALQSR